MRDFFYAAQQIPGLVRYFKFEDFQFASFVDSGPLASNGGGPFNTPSDGSNVRMQGYLLDQHHQTFGAGFMGGHGFQIYYNYSLGTHGAPDSPNNQSWSVVLAGCKPHDMSATRAWHGLQGSASSDQGICIAFQADGTLFVTGAPGSSATSASGVIHQYVPHLVVVSYDFPSRTVTAWVGDWSGRWVTAINASALTAVTAFPNGNTGNFIGRSLLAGVAQADGMLDDAAIYCGHAITQTEALNLFNNAGYQNGVTYPRSQGHRSAPFNRAYPANQAIDSNSTVASAQMATYSSTPPQPNGAGSFNVASFTTSIYIVSKAFRMNPANRFNMQGPAHYTPGTGQLMEFEDTPVPYNARPSLGFAPSSGSDGHLSIYCPETDELWDMSEFTNSGTDLAPNWSFQVGGKITQFSMQLPPSFYNTSYGTTATGLPCILGIPTINELVAAQDNVTPIPHGLAVVVANCRNFPSHVYPAQRNDGSGGTTHPIIEGQVYRLRHDSATTALISAMPHVTGRALARATQTYGMLVIDNNGNFGNELQTEDSHQFLAVNGYDRYSQDVNGVTANGLLNGQTFSVQTMQGFPWSNLELLDATKVNPADASQPIQSAPTGLSGSHQTAAITCTWSDNANVQFWNVYQKVGASYTKIATTTWPSYTIYAPTGTVTFAISAVNGGGESAKSADFTPPLPLRSRRRSRSSVG